MGRILFAFQIYGDFSGYSDIALGAARLLGFNPAPEFCLSVFLQRHRRVLAALAHLANLLATRLSLYPIGWKQSARWKIICNVFITLLVSGLWHGGNWTF